MKVDQVLQLIQAVSDSELTEFKYEEDGVKLSLKKTEGKIVQVQAPVTAHPSWELSMRLRQRTQSLSSKWATA